MAEMQHGWVPEPRKNTFATRLREVRAEMKMSREAFAELCGFAPKTYQTWEAGTRPQNRPEVVEAIVEATGCDRDWLMWGTHPLSTRCLSEQGSLLDDDDEPAWDFTFLTRGFAGLEELRKAS